MQSRHHLEVRAAATLLAVLMTLGVAAPVAAAELPAGLFPPFIENRGQWPEVVRFQVDTPDCNAWIIEDGVRFHVFDRSTTGPQDWKDVQAREHVFDMVIEGMRPGREFVGEAKRTTFHNYYMGPEPHEHHEHVPLYDAVRVKGALDAIDVKYYLTSEGLLEYDFIVKPGGDPSGIRLRYEGQESMRLLSTGGLALEAGLTRLDVSRPIAYQDVRGKRRPVAVTHRRIDEKTMGFQVLGDYDETEELVIDPSAAGQVYATYVTSSLSNDYVRGVAVDSAGRAVIAGHRRSSCFPFSAGEVDPDCSSGTTMTMADLFVTRLNFTGSDIDYTTMISRPGWDEARHVMLEENDDIVIVGHTSSPGFPTTTGPPHQGGVPAVGTIVNAICGSTLVPGSANGCDALIARFRASDGTMLNSSFFGGEGNDLGTGGTMRVWLWGSPVDDSLYMCGQTKSKFGPGGLPLATRGAVQERPGGGEDAFVARFDESLNLEWVTFLGGEEADMAYNIERSWDGDLFVVGETSSDDFPTEAAFDDDINGVPVWLPEPADGFLARLTADGRDLVFSTYLGGENADRAYDLEITLTSKVLVTGQTASDTYPCTGPIPCSTPSMTNTDVFITRMNMDGTHWGSIVVGGDGHDIAYGITATGNGGPIVTGQTSSASGFPTAGTALSTTLSGDTDLFILKFGALLNVQHYGTYVGGGSTDYPVFAEPVNREHGPPGLFVPVTSHSTDFPTYPVDPADGPLPFQGAGSSAASHSLDKVVITKWSLPE